MASVESSPGDETPRSDLGSSSSEEDNHDSGAGVEWEPATGDGSPSPLKVEATHMVQEVIIKKKMNMDGKSVTHGGDLPNDEGVSLSYWDRVCDYLASSSLGQCYLTMEDTFLGVLHSVCGASLRSQVTKRRRHVRAVKRAGMRRAGLPRPANTIGEASYTGYFLELLGANLFLAIFGLKLVPAFRKTNSKEVGKKERDNKDFLNSTVTAFEDVTFTDYNSDSDEDYSPSDSSEDSLEYSSDTEILYEDELATLMDLQDSEDDEVKEIFATFDEDTETVGTKSASPPVTVEENE